MSAEMVGYRPQKAKLCICRYHYNVADNRLAQHVEKGIEDGLYISSIASSNNLWALIMDAGTGFTDQAYELSPVFLHKVIIPKILYFAILWDSDYR